MKTFLHQILRKGLTEKINIGAQWCTKACKLFWSRFQICCKIFSMRLSINCCHWI